VHRWKSRRAGARALRYACLLRYPLEGGQGFHKPNGLKAHANDLAHEAHDVFGVGGAVGVGADAAVLVFRHLVLVNHPFERAAIAQAVFKAGSHGHCFCDRGLFSGPIPQRQTHVVNLDGARR